MDALVVVDGDTHILYLLYNGVFTSVSASLPIIVVGVVKVLTIKVMLL